MSTKPPSDEFMDAVCTGSGIRAQCDCGRTCFEDSTSAGDWMIGELEGLRQKAIEQPDKYIALDRVRTGCIDGKEFVVNCPCQTIRRYEDWIWTHRHIIANYVAAKAKRIAEEAYSDEAEAEALQEGIEPGDRHLKFVRCDDCGGYFPDELTKAHQGTLLCERCMEARTCVECKKVFDRLSIVDGKCDGCRGVGFITTEESKKPSWSDMDKIVNSMIPKARQDDEEQDLPF